MGRSLSSLVPTDSSQLKAGGFEKLPDQIMYPYAKPYDLQKHEEPSSGGEPEAISDEEETPGSIPSLGAGLLFGSLLGFGAYQTTQNPNNYYLLLGTSSILGGIMGARFYNSGKIMPAGLITILSRSRKSLVHFTHVQLKCRDALVDTPAFPAPFAGLGLPRVVQPSRFLETAYSNGLGKVELEEMIPHLRGGRVENHLGKTTPAHPTEIRTSISPSSTVELQHDKRISQLRHRGGSPYY
uniref:Transmembrane protein 14C n=1 Tax=Timema douglasi TaxID=61478 RepID=A0A7R8VEJ0_TIMDO|nr:unnamed protein product [Timema douglasi]